MLGKIYFVKYILHIYTGIWRPHILVINLLLITYIRTTKMFTATLNNVVTKFISYVSRMTTALYLLFLFYFFLGGIMLSDEQRIHISEIKGVATAVDVLRRESPHSLPSRKSAEHAEKKKNHGATNESS